MTRFHVELRDPFGVHIGQGTLETLPEYHDGFKLEIDKDEIIAQQESLITKIPYIQNTRIPFSVILIRDGNQPE